MFTPESAPLWLPFSPETHAQLEPMLRRGIAVFDTKATRTADATELIVWPMTRETIEVHKTILTTALMVTDGLAASIVIAAENGRHLSLIAARPPSPGSPLERGLAAFGGHLYSLLGERSDGAQADDPSAGSSAIQQ